jgi:hypothetical protein
MKPTVPDFREFFRSSPGLYLVLSPDLTIVDASDPYLQSTMTWRDEIKGAYIFDAFPDNPNESVPAALNLNASLQLVLKEAVPHTMNLQRYDVRDHVGPNVRWVEKY